MSLVRKLPRQLRKPFGFMYPNTHIEFMSRAGGYEPIRDKSRVQKRGQEEYYEWMSGEESQVWDEKEIFPGRLHLSVCIGPNQHMPLVIDDSDSTKKKLIPARPECVSYQYDSAARAERLRTAKWTERWMPLMLMATFGIILLLYFYVTIPSMAAMQQGVAGSMGSAAADIKGAEELKLERAKIEAGIIPGDIIVSYNGTAPP